MNAADPIRHFAPNQRFVYSSDWRFSIVNRGRTNNVGFINDQDYDSTAAGPLLGVVGDSYVEALLVPYDSSVQGRLAASVVGTGRVYSFGASGAALSQYLAMATDAARRFHPAGLAFVVVGNDFDESLLRYAGFPGLHVLVDSGGTFALRRIDYAAASARGLVRRSALGRYLAWNLQARVRLYALWDAVRGTGKQAASVGNTAEIADSSRVRESRRAVDYVLEALPKRTGLSAGQMLFIMDGKRPQLYSDSGLVEARESYFELMRVYLQHAAQTRGYEVIDLEPRFVTKNRGDGTRYEFETDGHWNSAGHAVAAAAISQSHVFQNLFGTPH